MNNNPMESDLNYKKNKVVTQLLILCFFGAFLYWGLISPNKLFCTFAFSYGLLVVFFVHVSTLLRGINQTQQLFSFVQNNNMGLISKVNNNIDKHIDGSLSAKVRYVLFMMFDLMEVPGNYIRNLLVLFFVPIQHAFSPILVHYLPLYVIYSGAVFSVSILLYFGFPENIYIIGGYLEFVYYFFPFYAIIIFTLFSEALEKNRLVAKLHPSFSAVLAFVLFSIGALISNISIANETRSLGPIEFLRVTLIDNLYSLPGRIQAAEELYAKIPRLISGTLSQEEKQDIHIVTLLAFIVGGLGSKMLSGVLKKRTYAANLDAILFLLNEGKISRAAAINKKICQKDWLSHSIYAAICLYKGKYREFQESLRLSSKSAFYATYNDDQDAHNFVVLCNFVETYVRKDNAGKIFQCKYNEFISEPAYIMFLLFTAGAITTPTMNKSHSIEDANTALLKILCGLGYTEPSEIIKSFCNWRSSKFQDDDYFSSSEANNLDPLDIAFRLLELLVVQKKHTAYRSSLTMPGLASAELAYKIPNYLNGLIEIIGDVNTPKKAILIVLVSSALKHSNTKYVIELSDNFDDIFKSAEDFISNALSVEFH